MQIQSDSLNQYCVSIQLDTGDVKNYVNSTAGRSQLAAECPEEIVQAIEAVWGSEPTVTESKEPLANTGPSETEQLRADVDYLSVMTGVTLT